MTNAATEPTHRDLPRLAFFVLGAMFFGLAVADRLVALFAGFSSLVLTIFLAWLLAFLIVPLVDGLVRRLHLRRGIAVAIAHGLVFGCVSMLVVAAAQVGVREAGDLGGQEAVAIAADQAEEIIEAEQAAQASMDGPRELPLVGGALVPNQRPLAPATNDSAS